MSGTSIDGIDVSAIFISEDGFINEIGHLYIDYSEEFKKQARIIEKLVQSVQLKQSFSLIDLRNSYPEIREFELELTKLHIKAVEDLVKQFGIKSIKAIGFHGQTLYHNPLNKITIQIGDGAFMSKALNTCVVNDFRSFDVASGGQGAPLVPIFHFALACQKNIVPLCVINCGGIANITIIPSSDSNELVGFDIGPGNVLIDRYMRMKTNKSIDLDGEYGKKGVINHDLLKCLYDIHSDYLNSNSPQSLCSSNFRLPDMVFDLNICDAAKTLEIFTARVIAAAFPDFIKNVVLVGGGWKNPVILNELLSRISCNILEPEALGVKLCSMESSAFAYLAYRKIHNLPSSFPKTTGVNSPLVLGNLNEICNDFL